MVGRPAADGIGLKLTCVLSGVPDLVRAAVDAGLTIRGSAGTGVLYAGGPGDGVPVPDVVGALRAAATRAGGHAVVLTAPGRDRLDMWGPVPGLDLMRRVKDRFDPHHRFAPGRFVGGI